MAIVIVRGRRVEYSSAGSGEVVVLSSPTWWPLDPWRLSGFPQLVDCFHVLAFNHRGIGKSDATPTCYTVDTMAVDLLDLLDTLQIPRAHIVCFAIGAVVGLRAALQAPGRVASLVLGATGEGGRPVTDGVPQGLLRELRTQGYSHYLRDHALGDFAFGAASQARNPERATGLADAIATNAGSEEEFLKHARARQGYQTLDGAEEVTQPCLVMVGEEDAAERGTSTPAEVARTLASRLPNARLEIVPGVRHMLYWDAPDQTWPVVRAFLHQASAAGYAADLRSA